MAIRLPKFIKPDSADSASAGPGAGYQAQGGPDGGGPARRRQSRFNPVTGTYTTQATEPPRRGMAWLWIVLAFAVIILFSSLVNRGDPKNNAPANNPDAISAMSDTDGLSNQLTQPAAPTNAPVATARQTLRPTKTPDPPSTPGPDNSLLKYGSKGEEVKALQGKLIALGYMALGKDDGAFGDVTQGALLSFQRVNSLKADGIAGEKTLALLDSGTTKPDPDVFVWVEDKGKVYHTDKDCSGMKNPKQIKLSQAEKLKLKPCDTCK